MGPNVDDDHGVDAKKSQKGFFPSSFQDVFNFFPPLSNVDDDILGYRDAKESQMDGEIFNFPPISNVDDDIGV